MVSILDSKEVFDYGIMVVKWNWRKNNGLWLKNSDDNGSDGDYEGVGDCLISWKW